MLFYIIYNIYSERFSSFSDVYIYVMFSTYGKMVALPDLYWFFLPSTLGPGNSNFFGTFVSMVYVLVLIWKMIENFDYNRIKNDSNLFFDHLKKICQINHRKFMFPNVLVNCGACRESESMIYSNLVAIFFEKQREKVESNLF